MSSSGYVDGYDYGYVMMSGVPLASDLLAPPGDAVHLDTGRGAIFYWELAPRVYVTEVRGLMTQPMSQLIMKQAEPLYAIGSKVHGFHNWFAMDNYDSVCRVELTSWVLRHRAQTGLHIGLRSRMVAMGVAVANLALGSLIQVHNEPRALEEALEALLRRGH
jgi:hypothetical protein